MNLNETLIAFPNKNAAPDYFTMRDAFNGIQIFGGIGSGKSSGSGKMFAKEFLKKGFGGLVLCAKPGEAITWREYGEETGRIDDFIFFNKKSDFEFNPLEYETTRSGEGAGEIFNLTNLFMEIYKMGNRFSGAGAGGGNNARFWDAALRRCINRTIQLLQLAKEEISIEKMRKIISSIPYSHEVENLSNMSIEDIEKWGEDNFCIACYLEAGGTIAELMARAEEETNLLEKEKLEAELSEKDNTYDLIENYFLKQFPNLSSETRPIIVESFLGLAEPFLSGILKKHFAGGISPEVKPEETFKGKIIVMEFPVKEFLQAGVFAQGIFKLLWQQATERRIDEKEEANHLPVFLWVDEAQLFLSDYDQIFQTTARSSRAATVFISQNISNYYVALGGANPKAKADSLLGNLGTKIFHSNNDAVTNEWASKIIGSDLITLRSDSEQKDRMELLVNSKSQSYAASLLPQILPKVFTKLWTGGDGYENPRKNYKVQAIVTINGKDWQNGKNYRKITFSQI